MDEGTQGLNILCFDGGGIRGLSSLLLLSEIMTRLQGLENSTQPLVPADYFDIIAGTGTRGLCAFMLGRLRMTVDEAIKAYINLTNAAFSDQKRIGLGGRAMYKRTKLQDGLKSMVRKATGNESELIREGGASDRCKTMVFAMLERNMNASIPTVFRSYEVMADSTPNCAIWEALYATMAHPDLFKPIEITDGVVRQSFVGGELGCSNPIAHVLVEARALYPERYMSCILSVGAGHARTIQISDSSFSRQLLGTHLIAAIKGMATDSERVAEEMAVRFQETPGLYHRFNVDQGLQHVNAGDLEKLNEVAAHTKTYLGKVEMNRKIDEAVETIKNRKAAVSIAQIDGRIIASSVKRMETIKRCPAPTSVFTGRGDLIQQVGTCIAEGRDERRVCVIHGMGGAGKTQLALKAIEQYRESWTHVLYVDASSRDAVEMTLQNHATFKDIGKTYEDMLAWLEQCCEPWLLMLDNADHPSLDIQRYFPAGNHGSILITTRLQDLDMCAKGPGSVCHISTMSHEDALTLLLKLAHRQKQDLDANEMSAATLLLHDFGYLALAVVHAGAYIGHSRHMSIGKYRNLFLVQRQSLLERYNDLKVKVDDYAKSVRTTWKMCYDLLAENGKSRPMLWLMTFLQHDNISEAIFERAAVNIRSYKPTLPPSEVEETACGYMREYLGGFLDSEGHWDTLLFSEAVSELASYSLIEFDLLNISYSMYVLVQEWVRSIIPQSPSLALECATTLLAQSVDWDTSAESYSFKRGIGLHVNKVLSGRRNQTSANHTARFAEVYRINGRWQEQELLELHNMETGERMLGTDHPWTLGAISSLASTHLNQGRWNESEALQARALDARKRILGDEHPDTLASAHSLAMVYQSQGRWEKAEDLQTQLLDAFKRQFGNEHRSTILAMHNLASTYQNQGRLVEATELQAEVLDIGKRILGETHPDTLLTMHNLASTYVDRGDLEEAKALQVQVLDARKSVLGEEHPDTLMTMHNLALIYQELGQGTEAESLSKWVLEAESRILGEEHPNTLLAMYNLGLVYNRQDRWAEAEALQMQVTRTRKRILGEEHPNTLLAMNATAAAYAGQGRWPEAESLQAQVLDIRQRLLGEEHPDTLITMNDLAMSYYNQSRWAEAEPLQVQVLDIRKRLDGDEHPYTLTAINNLGLTYQKLGRWAEAEGLHARALNTQIRVLGEEHPDTLTTMSNLALSYWNLNRRAEAEALFIQVLGARTRTIGSQHPYTLDTRNVLETIQSMKARKVINGLNLAASCLYIVLTRSRYHVVKMIFPRIQRPNQKIISVSSEPEANPSRQPTPHPHRSRAAYLAALADRASNAHFFIPSHQTSDLLSITPCQLRDAHQRTTFISHCTPRYIIRDNGAQISEPCHPRPLYMIRSLLLAPIAVAAVSAATLAERQSSCACGYKDSNGAVWKESFVSDFTTGWSTALNTNFKVFDYEETHDDVPYGMKYNKDNVYSYNDGLGLKTSAYSGSGRVQTAGIQTLRDDMLYGSFRMRATVKGVCFGFFTYKNWTYTNQEADVEFLSSDADYYQTVHHTNQPGLLNGDTDPDAYHKVVIPGADFTQTVSKNSPNLAASIIANVWSDGGSGWTQGPPTEDAIATVYYIKGYFNSTSLSDSTFNSQCAAAATKTPCSV